MPEKKADMDTRKPDSARPSLFRRALYDRSLWPLLAANAAAIIFAVIQNWDLMTMMWIYWAQNIIIGFFHFLRILFLKEFSAAGLKVNGRPVDATPGVKKTVAFFFLFHFNFFHLVYLLFMSRGFLPEAPVGAPALSGVDCLFTGISIGIFFLSSLFAFLASRKTDRAIKPNLGVLMFFPYARILPMHLTIIFGVLLLAALANNGSLPVVILFLIIKTLADAIMQVLEKRIAKKSGVSGVRT